MSFLDHLEHPSRRAGLRHVAVVPPLDATERLLLAVARGEPGALLALRSRMVDLVRLNVRRVLEDDGSRCDAVTQRVFADLPHEAVHFDPDKNSALAWLLARAHRCAMDEMDTVSTVPESAP